MVIRLIILIGLFCIMIGSMSCDSNKTIGEPAGGFVEGVVYEKGTTDVIDSVEITLLIYKDQKTGVIDTTDITGFYFIFSGFNNGKMFVRAEKENYEESIKEVFIISGDTATVNFDLEKKQGK